MTNQSNAIYQMFNAVGIATAYLMLSLSVWLAPVDLSTKGYWGMGIFLLTLALVNFVKYRIEDRQQQEHHERRRHAQQHAHQTGDRVREDAEQREVPGTREQP